MNKYKQEVYKNQIRYYIVDKGYSNVQKITQRDIEEMIKKMQEEEIELAKKNQFSILSVEYAEWLVKTSAMITKAYTIGQIINLEFDI